MRTPLTSIRGFSQTLLNSWDKIDEENKKKFVKIIEEQSNRLINLVENILTVSKINSDKPILKEVYTKTSILKVIEIINQKYPTHKIVTQFNNHLPPIKADEDKFQQVIMNLIENACKYSEPNKTVTLSTSFSDSDNVLISIKDEGVGIKKEDFDKIFEKFIRLENHLTSKTQGNGLGLYITKNLVEGMNGSIELDSELGKGTVFKIRFPFYNQEEALKCSQRS